MASQHGGVSKALPDIPVDLIKAAAEEYPEVKVITRRATPKGTWASCPQITIPMLQLGTFDEYLREHMGGGRYRVVGRDPANELNEIIPSFYIEIEGPSKVVGRGYSSPGVVPGGGGMPLAQDRRPGFPRYGQGMPTFAMREQQRNDPADSAQLDPSDFMSMTPDAIAMEVYRNLKDELKRERGEEKQRAAEDLARVEREREQRHQAERERDALERKHEKELMELRLEMQRGRENAAPKIDYVGLAAAIVPLGVAIISAGTSKQSSALTAQQEAARMQNESIKQIFEKIAQKPDNAVLDTLKIALPVLSPLLLKFFEERSPGAAAKLMSSMAEGQLETISMMSQLMQQMQPDNDNPWIEVAGKVLTGIQDLAGQMVEMNRGARQLPGGNGAAARMTQGRPTQQPPQRQQAAAPSNGHGVPAQKPLTAQSLPKEFADAIVGSPNVPPEFKSREWYEVFVALHDLKLDPKKAAQQLVDHLENLADKNALPEMLGAALDLDVTPSAVVRPFLQELPLSQLSADRVEVICIELDDLLSQGTEPVAEKVEQPPAPARAVVEASQVFTRA